MNLKIESGRSMVEMLGTLAIIGVLSIGGIAGYSYGMDKYRCNQTMNDISLRTVDLITQASQGRAELSLSEWKNEDSIYDFSNPAYSDDGLIMFDVGVTEKIPQGVCQMIFDGLSNTAVQIDINESVATSKDSCGEDNTMTFYFEGGGATTDIGATGEQCGGTVCGTCQKCENETCVTVPDYEQKCTANGQSGWCVSGACQPESCNCGPNQYCADYNTSATQANPGKGCVDLKYKEYMIEGTTYYVSDDDMSWWDAASFCDALGKSMVSHTSFVQTCNSVDGSGCSSAGYELNSFGKTFKSKVTVGDCIWSSIVNSSRSAFSFCLYDGDVRSSYERDSSGGNYFYAVCK